MDETTPAPQKPISMVLYTDGGCRQQVGGYGIHGYTYFNNDDEDKKKKKKAAVGVPSTDGYIIKDDPHMDKRTVVRPHEVIEMFAGIKANTTNNVAELKATINGIDLAIEKNAESLLVYSDSEYVGKGITSYLPKWVKNNWLKSDGTEIANKDLWKDIHKRIQLLKDYHIKFDMQWVKAHAGHRGNMFADYMATRGVFCGRIGDESPHLQIQSADEYDKYTSDRPRFVSHSRWYFNLGDTNVMSQNEHGFYEYYFGHPPESDRAQVYLGKALADSAFSVVWLKQPEKCLDLVHTRIKEVATDYMGNLFKGKLDVIYNAFNHKEIMDYGGSLLQRANSFNNDIVCCTGAVIAEECNPPRISYRAVTNLQFLAQLLNEYVTGNHSKMTRMYDITDSIYTKEVGKKGKETTVLHKDIKQNTKSIKVPVSCDVIDKKIDINTTLTFCLDIPIRNTLNGVTELNPKVTIVLYKESDVAFRYFTISECDDGLCIMGNVYANLRILSKEELALAGHK